MTNAIESVASIVDGFTHPQMFNGYVRDEHSVVEKNGGIAIILNVMRPRWGHRPSDHIMATVDVREDDDADSVRNGLRQAWKDMMALMAQSPQRYATKDEQSRGLVVT